MSNLLKTIKKEMVLTKTNDLKSRIWWNDTLKSFDVEIFILQFTFHIFIIIYLLLLIILFYFILLYYYKDKPKLRLRWGKPFYPLDTFKGIYEKDIVTGF
jgi:hypothetical protein